MGLLLVSSMTFCIDINVFFFEIFKFLFYYDDGNALFAVRKKQDSFWIYIFENVDVLYSGSFMITEIQWSEWGFYTLLDSFYVGKYTFLLFLSLSLINPRDSFRYRSHFFTEIFIKSTFYLQKSSKPYDSFYSDINFGRINLNVLTAWDCSVATSQ